MGPMINYFLFQYCNSYCERHDHKKGFTIMRKNIPKCGWVGDSMVL